MARAQRAVVLIAQGEDLEDVASAVGFRSVSAFGTAFRRVTGMTPGAFRSDPAA
jgi:AraC-like DNA-binding protein